MIFEIVGSFIAILLFLFSYIQLKKVRHHETTTYCDGLDGVHTSITHNSGGDI
ncbi:hypothetical protein CQZ94_02405 [Bacillus sp. MYb209]|uniref:hypothetical protein n=1 Tax=Bacillus sp. MYb209 TaxID=1848605 RepID=UPI000D48F35D|nr:hypothetical protein [Bacillus sp. MYb209]PQZ59732.1 hypothetical protein CQZ94_02405 [Bacillus sp. MYb209]